MQDIDQGDGSLLDNSVVMHGSGMKDGNVHEGVDIPIALFGNAGGMLKTNRLIACPIDTMLAQLHLLLLRLFGTHANVFNGVTSEPIANLI